MPVAKYGFPKKVKREKKKRGPGRPPKKKDLVKREVYEAFCDWAALPTPLKEHEYAKDFAEAWGVSEVTLSNWKKRESFWKDVAERRIDWARDKTSDVINGLFKRAATRGEAAEVKLWMQLIEDWSEKAPPPSPNITVIGIRGVTEEEIARLKQKPDESEEAEVVED